MNSHRTHPATIALFAACAAIPSFVHADPPTGFTDDGNHPVEGSISIHFDPDDLGDPKGLRIMGPFGSGFSSGGGLWLNYLDATQSDGVLQNPAIITFGANRKGAEWHWQVEPTSASTDRLQMKLADGGTLTLFDPANASNTIELQPGSGGSGAGIRIGGQPVLTQSAGDARYHALAWGGSVLLPGGASRALMVADSSSTWGNDLWIAAGGGYPGTTESPTNNWGGTLIMSSGAASGSGGSMMEFRTVRSDNGPGAHQPEVSMRINQHGGVGIGAYSGGGSWNAQFGGLDVSYGGSAATLMLGAEVNSDIRRNEIDKVMTIAMTPWSNPRAPFTVMGAWTPQYNNLLYIGGGFGGAAASEIEFYTGPNQTPTGSMRMYINDVGGVGIGTGCLAGDTNNGDPAQVVVGRYNDVNTNDNGTDHRQGVFIIGAGSAENNRGNALRVLSNKTVLVTESGDLSMGEFQAGPTP